ncbi:hypothetical protein ACWDSL_34600 [Streptomyces sp. NPDC000941]
MDLGKLGTAVADWKTMVGDLAKLKTEVSRGLVAKSEAAGWQGVNATVTREFVRSTAKEFGDLHLEAESIYNVLQDAHTELTAVQKRAKRLDEEARKGSDKDPGMSVSDNGNGTVTVRALCSKNFPLYSQRSKGLEQWYADTLTGLVAHASEIDAAVSRALKNSHGGQPLNPGHAKYTSLDEDQLPRAVKLAELGGDANPRQRAELGRLWQSLSPEARAQLWKEHKKDLLAAGLLETTIKRISPDAGSGPHGAESPGMAELETRAKMQLLAEGADLRGMTDAARHMMHYLDNTGRPMYLPVDKMLSADKGFQAHIDKQIRDHQNEWRKKALAEFWRNGGKPVAIPVQTGNRSYSFDQEKDPNWFFAVNATNSNVTGVVTVEADASGKPKVGLDYQTNAWDRYNWDKGKGVDIGPIDVPDGQPSRLHKTGLAQEFDVSGSSSVKHYDLGGSTPNNGPLPKPDEPWR